MIPLFEKDGFIICAERRNEIVDVRSHFTHAGHEKKDVDKMVRQVHSGRRDWFGVSITAWKNRKKLGEATLGCCFYRNFDEFLDTTGDYLDDLVKEAINAAKEKHE